MRDLTLNDNQVREFGRNGFVLARGLFNPEEIGALSSAAREDHELDRRSFGRADGEGGTVRLSLWNHPGACLSLSILPVWKMAAFRLSPDPTMRDGSIMF